ncbi:MAG: hypothetical protein H0W58_13795 [Acidobacteria bacterium]|nr:hypothetical protein [Acidobacteriota bacterium]
MKRSFSLVFLLVFLVFTSNLEAQKRRIPKKSTAKSPVAAQKSVGNSNTAVVVDERLAVLRDEPSLFAKPVQRMRLGRIVSITGSKEADGVMFYRVAALPNNYGWVQAQAVFGKSRRGDDERLARLVQYSDGFEQIERAAIFLETFADSPLRPAILLLLGDLMEETALKLSKDATNRLDRREMAASGAPLHSFYLNYVSLDRYRKVGIGFVFNSNTKLFHYDGASWREIVNKFPKSSEAVEAQKRLNSLNEKMEKKVN